MGLSLALVTRLVTLWVTGSVQLMSDVKSSVPLEGYFVWGFSPLLAAGVCVGSVRVKRRTLTSVLVGISYPVIMCLIKHFTGTEINLTGSHSDYFAFFAKALLLSALLTAGTAAVAARLRGITVRGKPSP